MKREKGTYLCRIGVMLLGAALVVLGGQACRAQTAEETPSVFRQLFPMPTGMNGYEDLVQAGELARDSILLGKAEEPGATYRMMRDALSDPPVVRALKLLRAGLAKPVLADRNQIDENTILPELPLLRG